MGAYGLRPVAEIQFADYMYPGYDQIVSGAARLRYRSAGDFTAPITIRMPCGGGIYGGQTHSQSPEALFTHVCGLRTVMPSNPYDAKGLLIASIECDDPVIFLEPKRLYNGPFDGHHERPVVPWTSHPLAEVPEGHYTVPLESAAVFRPGSALTVLTYGTMVWVVGRRGRARPASTPRSSTCAALAARPRHDRRVGEEDRPLRDRARGDAHQRLRRGARGARAGALLLSPRGADRARDRLGHPYPHAQEWAYFPGPDRVGEGARSARWRHEHGHPRGEGSRHRRRHRRGRDRRVARAPGDTVVVDQVLADVMTDKATVEVPTPVAGRVLEVRGERRRQARRRQRAAAHRASAGGRADAPQRRVGACGGDGRSAAPAPVEAAVLPAQPRSPPSRSAEAARVAVGAPPRARAGRRSRQVRGNAGPTGGSSTTMSCVTRPAARRGFARCCRAGARRALRAALRRGRGAGHRPAPPDRAADAGRPAHSALHLRRGGRRHGARGAARASQRRARATSGAT